MASQIVQKTLLPVLAVSLLIAALVGAQDFPITPPAAVPEPTPAAPPAEPTSATPPAATPPAAPEQGTLATPAVPATKGPVPAPADPKPAPAPAEPAPSAEPPRKPPAETPVAASPPPPDENAPDTVVEPEFIGPPSPEELVGPPEALAPEPPSGPVEIKLLGTAIVPGERKELRWKLGESFDGGAITTPVTVLHGAQPGPRLCLTAAIHGDELNGVEVVRRVVNGVDPKELSGTLVGVPIVNLLGFSRGSRYLPDRRDLNRYFPGTPTGSAASRIAYSLFRSLVEGCDAVVDFHTGSFDRSNLPQVRGDLTLPNVLEFTRGFGATPVLHSPGTRGMLRLAATDRGVPAVTFEVGAPLRLEPDKIDFAVEAIHTLMHKMGMTRSFRMWAEPQATFYESKWVRSDFGGMLFSSVRLGDRVRQGQRLGEVIDPVKNEEHEVVSPFRGRVIGMALNQVVLPGFAAYHIGIETSEADVVQDAASTSGSPDAIEQLEGDQMNEGLGGGEARGNGDGVDGYYGPTGAAPETGFPIIPAEPQTEPEQLPEETPPAKTDGG
jgi:hypothetical protein